MVHLPRMLERLSDGRRVLPSLRAGHSGILCTSGKDYTEKLIAALDHPEPETPIRAAWVLGRMGDQRAVAGLVRLLETTQDVYLTYEARHTLPADEDDTTFLLSVPESDEELIRLYVKAKISEQTRTKQATLDRFKQGSGRRDDNPLEPEVGDLMGEYRMKIAERTSGGIILLFRPGRRR